MKLSPHNIVVDIETLATSPDAVILSIGAAAVDLKDMEVIDNFYLTIRTKEQLAMGRVEDKRTREWWDKQAGNIKEETWAEEWLLKDALVQLRLWMKFTKGVDGAISVWGNGAAFDNTILAHAYNMCDVPMAWHYRYDRCFRTVKAMFPEVVHRPQDPATKHHALHDAVYEAQCLIRVIKYLEDRI